MTSLVRIAYALLEAEGSKKLEETAHSLVYKGYQHFGNFSINGTLR